MFNFFEERLKCSASPDVARGYEAIPYEFYESKKSFHGIVDHAVDTVRRLFVSDDYMFQYTGGRLMAAAFPAFSDELDRKLMSLVAPAGTKHSEVWRLTTLTGLAMVVANWGVVAALSLKKPRGEMSP